MFDRLEVELQPVRVSINQDLIDQIKLYTFPPPHDTRMAQQAFIFSAEAASTSTPGASTGAADETASSTLFDRRDTEPEPTPAAGAGRGISKGHFGDRDLGFKEDLAQGNSSASNRRGIEARDIPAEPLRLSLVEADESDEGIGDDDDGSPGARDMQKFTQAADQTAAAMERAQKAHAFGTIRIGTLDIEASYTGKLLPAFERLPLQMKMISYKREVWTMQELLEHLGWDIKKAVLKSVANSTISGVGSKMSKFAGQVLAPGTGAKRSQFEMKRQQLLGQVPSPGQSGKDS